MIGARAAVDTFRAEGLSRAAFELHCPPGQIQVHELTPGDRFGGNYTASVAVTGCGQQTVYYKHAVHTWIRNSEIQQASR